MLHRVVAAPGDDRIGPGRDRAERRPQDLVCGDRIGKAEGGRHEHLLRSLADARDVGRAADRHLDAGRLGRRCFIGGFGGHLRGMIAAALEGAQPGDGLAALDVAAAEVEDARHQPFIFLA